MAMWSERLEMLASLAVESRVLADVGCDHGFFALEMLRRGICSRAIAMEVARGPLEAARRHLVKAGLGERVEFRLSDGLEALRTGEADLLCLAGIGGDLMGRILEMYPARTRSFGRLLCQPQSHLPAFRLFALCNGLRIEQEAMVWEGGKPYTALALEPSEAGVAPEALWPVGLPDVADPQAKISLEGNPPWEEADARGAGKTPEEVGMYAMARAKSDFAALELQSPEGKQALFRIRLRFGPMLLEQSHPALERWLQRELEAAARLEAHLLEAGGEGCGEALLRNREMQSDIRRALEVYFGC